MATISKFGEFVQNQLAGNAINFNTNTGSTLKVALYTSAVSPSGVTNSAQTRADLATASMVEVSGTGYTARGNQINHLVATSSAGTTTVTGDSVTWSINAAGFTNARYAVIYNDSGTDSSSYLYGWIDLGGNQGITTGSLIINWNQVANNGAIFSLT